ncbi:MAG: hypothetical protein IIZ31_02670, partial [Lachnospiraceae bacterium]|nr:hypothetical protein [Lachnospiraceae bacterium]
MIIGFIFYFVLEKYLNKKPYALESVKKAFLFVGYVELFLYTTQYLLINVVKFLNYEQKYRLDEVRMNFASIAVPFVIFNSINNMFREKRIIGKDLLLVLVGFFYSFFVTKTRILI